MESISKKGRGVMHIPCSRRMTFSSELMSALVEVGAMVWLEVAAMVVPREEREKLTNAGYLESCCFRAVSADAVD